GTVAAALGIETRRDLGGNVVAVDERGVGQLRALEQCAREIGLEEVGTAEVGVSEHGLDQPGFAELRGRSRLSIRLSWRDRHPAGWCAGDRRLRATVPCRGRPPTPSGSCQWIV